MKTTLCCLLASLPWLLWSQQSESNHKSNAALVAGPLPGAMNSRTRQVSTPALTSPTAMTNGGRIRLVTIAPRSLPAFKTLTGSDVEKAPTKPRPLLRLLTKADVVVAPMEIGMFVPELGRTNVHVLDVEIWLNQRRYALGAVIVRADIDSIRSAERDFRQYMTDFKDTYSELYPLENSYILGTNTDLLPFISLQVQANHRKVFGCSAFKTLMTLHEHWFNGNRVVDYVMQGSLIEYMEGVDFWFTIASQKGFYGFLQVTLFGYSIDKCWEGFSDIRKDTIENMIWTRDQAERRFRERE